MAAMRALAPLGSSTRPVASSTMRSRHPSRPPSLVVVSAAGKRPSAKEGKGGGGATKSGGGALPPGVRAEGELSERERTLLADALRDSQEPPEGSSLKAKKARTPPPAKKGFATPAAAASAAGAEAASSAPPPSVRAIDAREAARGRVELVNVRNWGGGGEDGRSAAEAGDLEIVSMRTLVGGGGGAAAAAAVGKKTSSSRPVEQSPQKGSDGVVDASSAAPPPPLHVALAQQLQLAEARGALSIASSVAAKPLPPFERWSFSPRSYAQYLADHAEAHSALDDALDGAVAQAKAHSLRWFARERGIARGDAYASDLRAMVASMVAEEEDEEKQQQQPPAPSNGAAALARLLRRLGRDAGSASDGEDAHEAALKLAAHAYALRAAHLSGSGRITAAAEGRLGLGRRGALAAVARYGNGAALSSPPPAAFSADVDAYGREMMKAKDGDDGSATSDPYAWAGPLFAELPAAFRKASSLLDALATDGDQAKAPQ